MLGRMDFWDHLTTFLTTGLPAILAALAAFIQSLRNAGKAEQVKAKVEELKAKVEQWDP